MSAVPNDPWSIPVYASSGHEIDPNEVSRALRLYLEPGHYYTVQGLPSARSRQIHADDLIAAVEAVRSLADDRGVYVTLNPVPATIGDRVPKSAEILNRKRLLIDIDARRSDPNGMATEDEKALAWQVASAIVAFLESLGWPVPLIMDSGNGVHLIFALDLPNTPLSRQLLSRLLKSLALGFNTDGAVVDVKVHDARRITKLPGTWVRKGENTAERPYRLAKIHFEPSALEVVTIEQIQAVAGTGEPDAPAPTPPPNRDPWTMTAGTAGPGDLSRYVAKVVDGELARLATSRPPAHGGEGRNNALNAAAFALGTLCDWPEFNAAVVRNELRTVAERTGLDAREIDRTIESGWTAGQAKPRPRPEPRGSEKGKIHDDGAAVADAAKRAGKSLVIWANTVTPRKVEWLWPNRIPLGKLTTFAGRTGLGKTFALCDIAARVSTGAVWPFCGGERAEPGKVLFISAEDDIDDTLVPRLMQLGADLGNIAFLAPETEERFTLAALELLSSVLDEMQDVRYIAIDPPTSYLAGIDDHNNAELRSVLGPLKRWCAKHRVGVVLNTHVNKSSGANVEAVSRVMGSVAWVNAVRAAFMFTADPDDKDRRLFLPLKMNIGKEPDGLSYRILWHDDGSAKLEWLGTVDLSADDAMNNTKRKPKFIAATDWLIRGFRAQLEWPSDQFWASAKEHGIARRELDAARERLQVPKPRKATTVNGDTSWVWWVPPDWPYLNRDFDGGGEELVQVVQVDTTP